MRSSLTRFLCLLVLIGWHPVFGQPEIDYERPSDSLSNLVERPLPSVYHPSPKREQMLKLNLVSLIPEAHLRREEVSLAGFQMYRDTSAKSRRVYAKGLSVIDVASGTENTITGLPPDLVVLHVLWSPDSKHVATLLERENQVELWVIETTEFTAWKLSDLAVHAAMDELLFWSSDSQHIWVKTIPKDRKPFVEDSSVERLALVRETSGQSIPAQTHQGTLRTQKDVELFKHYFTASIAKISLTGTHEMVGEPGVYGYFRESPDQQYLLVERLVEPWSYWVNAEQFAYDVEVWEIETEGLTRIAGAPLAETLPYGGGAVRLGARKFSWRSDKPSTVVWVEALDNGSPYEIVRYRDQILSLQAPFDSAPKQLVKTRGRVGDIMWNESDRALIFSWDWVERDLELSSFNPNKNQKDIRTLLSFDMGDRYRHPGFPLMKLNESGFPMVHSDESGEHMFLVGEGGSLEGDRPFLDRFNFDSRRKKRLFRSKKPYFETPITVLDGEGQELLVRRESPTMPPTYFSWSKRKRFHSQLTFDENPYPELEKVQRTLVKYKRGDGVQLMATLYLPVGYNAKRDGPLPTLVWAYPKAYQNAQNASQLKKSPYQFLYGRWNRPIIWATQGYAVLDDPTMPIIAQSGSNANDTFIPQLVDSANAVVRELIRRGVSEKDKIALGGHSYGAFMTANLLAHTDLFCAGIARGGAYNRTLTPFGFQSEKRILWQSPRVYLEMSPFLNAGHINEPLLLLHGEEDKNPGTHPMQSERLFHALNGLGKHARLVMLPYEGHTFRGEKGVLHNLWEMERWLEIHVKGDSPISTTSISQSDQSGPSANDSSAEGAEK